MNTLKHYLGALRLAIMGAFGFLNYASPSMGAKTGVITAPTGADENLKTLGASQPVRDTLAGIVRSGLQLASALKKAYINFLTRKAVINSTSAGVAAAVEAVADVDLLGVLTKDDPTKATSPWTFAGEGFNNGMEALITAITATRKPSMSVESLVNALEDTQLDPLFEGGYGLAAVIDQASGEISVYRLEDATAGGLADAAALSFTEDVQYVQALDSGGSQFGE